MLFSTDVASRGVPAEFSAMHANLSTAETSPFHWFEGAGRMEGEAHNCSPILKDSLIDGPAGVKANISGGDPLSRALSLIRLAIRLAISLDETPVEALHSDVAQVLRSHSWPALCSACCQLLGHCSFSQGFGNPIQHH